MIEIKAKQEELAAAGRVAAHVNLEKVFLLESSATNRLAERIANGEEAVAGKLWVEQEALGFQLFANNKLLVKAGANVRFVPSHQDEDMMTFRVVYAAVYGLPSGPVPEDVRTLGLTAFSRLNGLYNCWPYLRSEVGRIASSMNLQVILPLLRIVPERKEEAEHDVQSLGTETKAVKKRKSSRRKLASS